MNTLQALSEGRSQTVVVYGTSLTAEGAWTRAMKDWFDARFPGRVTFANSGGSGQNSDWGLANLADKVLAHRPDLVFIEFSYNDAHVKFDLPLERASENLAGMVDAIRRQNPQTDIVLQTMNLPWDCPGGSPSAKDRPRLGDYNDIVRRHAARAGLPLVDHAPAWKKIFGESPENYRRMVPDGSHPTHEASRAVTWANLERFLEDVRNA
jgi:acyl-CoA thioesterase-1